MKRLIRSAGLALTILIVTSSTVLAEPLNDQLKNKQDKLKQDKAALQNVQGQLDALEQNIEMMDEQIGSLANEIDKNKKKIANTEKDIQVAEKELQATKDELQKSKDLFNKRVRAMYISGTEGYLHLLLNANGISDLMSKFEAMEKLISYDKKVMSDVKAKQDEINKNKEILQSKEEKLSALDTENENKILKLRSDKQSQSKLIAEAKKNEQVLALNVSATQTQVNATLQHIAEVRKPAPDANPSRGAVGLSNDSVIAYASNFLGTPYVWGGTRPVPGFDCSGFTQYVYAHFGIALGRTTYDQINDGVEVSKDQLQPGDLVFFGTRSNPHHMGIYAGNNTYVHAPHTGDVIKISPMSRSDFAAARRVK